ncbi:MAG: sulfatase-like hydrolase/transferase, partial [bacterium]|nr:sulfatase-like hydrolase/transferase [bacterium]
ELIAELDEAGLRDNTLVIFWGDHGAGLARAKRWLYDSGVRVPIIARWPGKVEPGTVRNDLVQFLDFAPTLLGVAGIDRPDYMDGRVILGDRIEPAPERLYFGRDRMDERYDMIRAVRDHRFKYIRNFESHKPWVQFMRTPSQGLVYQELGRLKEEGKLDRLTGFFMRDTKPYEEIYDTLVDPYEMHNLAADPEYREVVTTMRRQLVDWMKRTNDHGLVPEPELYRRMYPENRQEVTAAPTARTSQSGGSTVVELTSATEGASIAYTLESGDNAHWRLYTKPVSISPGKTLRAKAIRLGFEESRVVTVDR